MTDTETKPELKDFDVWCEFAGPVRVKAADAHAARAIVDGMAEQAIFNEIKDKLEVSWPVEKSDG